MGGEVRKVQQNSHPSPIKRQQVPDTVTSAHRTEFYLFFFFSFLKQNVSGCRTFAFKSQGFCFDFHWNFAVGANFSEWLRGWGKAEGGGG